MTEEPKLPAYDDNSAEFERWCANLCEMCARRLPFVISQRDTLTNVAVWYHETPDGRLHPCNASGMRERAYQEKEKWQMAKTIQAFPLQPPITPVKHFCADQTQV